MLILLTLILLTTCMLHRNTNHHPWILARQPHPTYGVVVDGRGTSISSSVRYYRGYTKRKIEHMQKSKQTVVCCTRCYCFLLLLLLLQPVWWGVRSCTVPPANTHVSILQQLLDNVATYVARSTSHQAQVMAADNFITVALTHRAHTLCNRNTRNLIFTDVQA